MHWSITLGRIYGTAVRIHVTFVIFLLWIALADYAAGGTAAAAASLVFLVLIFACVLAHEFGHILTARSFGIRTPDVTLLPIGGVASMERIPDEPRQELLIAIAGPLVNVVIALTLILWNRAGPGALWSLDFERASLVERLAYTNAALVLFNLVPAFPMDGGRVLRALLAMALGLPQATRIAARIGQAFAVVFVVLGLFYNPFLIFIGLFIYIAAASEQQASDFRWFAHDLKVAAGMEAKVASLPRSASLADAVTALLASPQRDFPVVDEEGRPVGLLDREDLLATLRQDGPETPVAQVMRVAEPVRDTQPLEEAMAAMNREGLKAQIVVDSGGRLVGLLTRENIAEMMLIHAVRPDWRFSSGRRGI